MTFTGNTAYPQYMGVYERSEKTAHGAPVFLKTAGDMTHYLYRYANGNWMVTANESDFAQGDNVIESSKAADLPSEDGLTWKDTDVYMFFFYTDQIRSNDDPAMTCIAVRETRHEHEHAYSPHP